MLLSLRSRLPSLLAPPHLTRKAYGRGRHKWHGRVVQLEVVRNQIPRRLVVGAVAQNGTFAAFKNSAQKGVNVVMVNTLFAKARAKRANK